MDYSAKGEKPLNVLQSAELKPRGIAAAEDALRAGPVYLLMPDTAGPSCLEWLLDLPPAAAGRSRGAIDADLNKQRDLRSPVSSPAP